MSQSLMQLPLIVGITGHIDLVGSDKKALREKITSFFVSLKKEYPNTPITILNSLAPGADQLCAEVALGQGVALLSVLPMPLDEYSKDFVDQAELNRLLKLSSNTIVSPTFEITPEAPSRGFFYRQAGHYIASNCHILLALWNGEQKLTTEGGGTYETLTFSRTPSAKNKLYEIKTPKLVQLFTPRESQPETSNKIELYNLNDFDRQSPFDINYKDFKLLDEYNSDYKKVISIAKTHAPAKNFYSIFDRLAVHYQNKTKRMLQSFSFLGFIIICSFLLYDEMESNLMLLVYGFALIVVGIIYIINKKRDNHQKYINYRALAENFRIQKIFESAGLSKNCYDCFNFAANYELSFVRTFLLSYKNLANHTIEKTDKFGVANWIEEQYKYHTKTFHKKRKLDWLNDTVSRAMVAASVLIFLLVIVLEFFSPSSIESELSLGNFGNYLLLHQNQPLSVRSVIKILLGAVSATTAILSNYFGNLALNEQIRASRRMIELFASAKEKIGENGIDDDILFQIGCECINENTNWYISELKNAPEILIG